MKSPDTNTNSNSKQLQKSNTLKGYKNAERIQIDAESSNKKEISEFAIDRLERIVRPTNNYNNQEKKIRNLMKNPSMGILI